MGKMLAPALLRVQVIFCTSCIDAAVCAKLLHFKIHFSVHLLCSLHCSQCISASMGKVLLNLQTNCDHIGEGRPHAE